MLNIKRLFYFDEHSVDLKAASIIWMIVIIITAIIFVVIARSFGTMSGNEVAFTILLAGASAIIGFGAQTIQKNFEAASRRTGIANIIKTDIGGIYQTLYSFEIERFSDAINKLGELEDTEIEPFARIRCREENYFTIFETLKSEMPVLSKAFLEDSVAFYTLMKGSRDAAMVLSHWKSSSISDVDVARNDAVTMFDILIEAATKAEHLFEQDSMPIMQGEKNKLSAKFSRIRGSINQNITPSEDKSSE